MSKPGTIYRITHQCFHESDDIQEVVDISDNDNLIDDGDTEEIIDLIPSGDPVLSEIVDNNEDPFTVIKSQQLIIKFNSDNNINMNTFASGSDNRWSVHNYIGALTLFKGFLVLDDMKEDFMPEPNIVQLTATDGLGLLKEIPLVDFDGDNPVGEYPIGEIIAMCLNQTGTPLQINIAFNIKPSGFVDDISIPNSNNQHLFDRVYLNAKTFEDKIGVSVDCYSCLEKILGEEAFIFQRQGAWWIIRVDEIETATRGMYITTFDSTGNFIENLGEKEFDKSIGKDSPYTIFFAKEQTQVIPTRPHKSVKLIYDYNFPEEIVENIDFERGDLLTDISATEKTYKIDNWVPFFSNTSSDDAPTTDIYIKREFEDGYEKERYIVIEASADFNGIMSEPIFVGVKDKLTLGISRRLSADIAGSGAFVDNAVQLRLYGNDGTFWTFRGKSTGASPSGLWRECNSIFRTNQSYLNFEGNTSDDQTEEISLYDGEVNEIPVAGYLRILIYASSQFGDTADTYINNLTFDYKPYINGSYLKYSSQSQEVTQSGDYKAKREENVSISDSPRFLFKGALLLPLLYVDIFSGSVQFIASSQSFQISGYYLAIFRVGQRLNIHETTSNNITCRVTAVSYSLVGNLTIVTVDQTLINETDATTEIEEMTFELANEFYNAALYPAGTGSENIHPYSEIQIFDIWNQFLFDRRVFQATLQGLDLSEVDSDLLANNAHLVHKYFLTDINDNTINRIFLLMTFNQNHRDGGWGGTLREIDNFTRTKINTGNVFKYNT